MVRNILGVVVLLILILSQAACVSMGKFELKEKEAAELGGEFQELQRKHAGLERENADLKAQVKQLTDDYARLGDERDRLAASNKGLEGSLKSAADAKNQKIAELSQGIDARRRTMPGCVMSSPVWGEPRRKRFARRAGPTRICWRK